MAWPPGEDQRPSAPNLLDRYSELPATIFPMNPIPLEWWMAPNQSGEELPAEPPTASSRNESTPPTEHHILTDHNTLALYKGLSLDWCSTRALEIFGAPVKSFRDSAGNQDGARMLSESPTPWTPLVTLLNCPYYSEDLSTQLRR